MGAELDAGGFGRGERADKHDRKRLGSTQVRGSRKEITPLLLLYWFIALDRWSVQQWCFLALC
jgi:hypothetical protein